MAVKTQTVIDVITDVTKDYAHERWTLAEISRWLNIVASLMAGINPRVTSRPVTLTLEAGARQDLRTIDPEQSWVRLHELVCNCNAAGEPVGETIRQIPRSALDYVFKTWRRTPATATAVKEYALDERSEFVFDVYPPVAAGTKVLALASVHPAPFCVLNDGALADANEVIPLADGYQIPLIDGTLVRMFGKDANDPTYRERAALHAQLFQAEMGVETKDAKPE